jgi:BioD-like phosphotransacetylase family protein
MVTDVDLFESPELSPLYFCLWGWMKSIVYERKVDIKHELLFRILNVAARIKKHEEQHTAFARQIQNALKYRWNFRKFVVNCENVSLKN